MTAIPVRTSQVGALLDGETGVVMDPEDESGVLITSPDGAAVIVKVEGSSDCDVAVDAPEDFSVYRF